MLCQKCGYYSENDESVCPACGQILKYESGFRQQGAQAIRQGKKAREALKIKADQKPDAAEARRRRSGASHATMEIPAVEDARLPEQDYFDRFTVSEDPEQNPDRETIERKRRTVYDDEADPEQAAKYLASLEGERHQHRRMVNWMKISLISVISVIVLVFGSLGFLRWTDPGQKIVIRLSLRFPGLTMPVSTAALWAVGDEMLDSGRIDEAIACYEKAKEQDAADPNGFMDPDGLMNLGSAYEAAGMIDKAAELYEYIYTETPSRPEAYIAHIRILQNNGQEKEAGELMQRAYESTGEKSFETQRTDLLPVPPEVKPQAGFYSRNTDVTLSSSQGYDVYYTFSEDAELPSGGVLYQGPIPLPEGTWTLRAVSLNGRLVSDEVKGTYRISLPQPMTPQSNLAPGTYKTSQRVKLKPGKDDIGDDHIVIYYTIDGSNPGKHSPIFTGEPIQLANGWVTLKAVAVNEHYKVSNTLEVKYKIEANPKPKEAFNASDTLDSLKLGSTTQQEFQEKYGEGTPGGKVESDDFKTECRRFIYPWGYAIMNLTSRKVWVVVEVYFSTPDAFTAPRGTGIGRAEKDVTNQFRDMLQLANDEGYRGLYEITNGKGSITPYEDGSKLIEYTFYSSESKYLTLDYYIGTDGTVTGIDLRHRP